MGMLHTDIKGRQLLLDSNSLCWEVEPVKYFIDYVLSVYSHEPSIADMIIIYTSLFGCSANVATLRISQASNLSPRPRPPSVTKVSIPFCPGCRSISHRASDMCLLYFQHKPLSYKARDEIMCVQEKGTIVGPSSIHISGS